MEGAGTEWISCACGHWLHEDCAENRVIESSGCEKVLSLLCVLMIMLVRYIHVHLHSVTCIGSSSLVQHIVHVECSLHIIRSSSVCQL